ncbi:ABC transporter permease [Ferroacidibacillus organovorans]|uniref:ABC transporter permease n=1 Tax=Ferroacidibacillus organovorans TaxID=1765683 RepID=UPI000A8183F2|nr:ABC transporter permease [Ferroacidibacillus organovorans]
MYARLVELWKYREMLWSMILSELRTRYRGSFLGFLWTFINPLLTLMVYTFIFSRIMKVTMPHYALFMFIGLLAWNLFATGIQSSASVIVRQGSLVKKIYFPREILPLSVVGGSVINYLLSLVILVPFLFINGYYPTVNWLYVPLILLMEMIFTVGLALLLSSLTVYLRDIEHMLGIFLMLWFYLTPVIYSLKILSPGIAQMFKLNPMSDVVLSFQSTLYYNESPHWKLFLYGYGISVVVLIFGWWLFTRLNRRFAEEV